MKTKLLLILSLFLLPSLSYGLSVYFQISLEPREISFSVISSKDLNEKPFHFTFNLKKDEGTGGLIVRDGIDYKALVTLLSQLFPKHDTWIKDIHTYSSLCSKLHIHAILNNYMVTINQFGDGEDLVYKLNLYKPD